MRAARPPLSLIDEGGNPPGLNRSGQADTPRVPGLLRRALTLALRTGSGRSGTAVGLAATGTAAIVANLGAAWFSFSDALDPPLALLILTAVLAWLAGILLLIAVVLACFPPTRALGLGYVVGAAIGSVLGVLGLAVLSLVAAVADAVAS